MHRSPRAKSRVLFRNGHQASPCQRRTLFGWMRKPQREIKDADIDPGLETMGALARMTSLSARKPPPDELSVAWRKFFEAKQQKNDAVQDFQATLALQTLRYLQVAPLTDEKTPWIETRHLGTALSVLQTVPKDVGQEHQMLARAIFEEVKSRQSSLMPDGERMRINLVSFLRVLAHTGGSEEAYELMQKELDGDTAVAPGSTGNQRKGVHKSFTWPASTLILNGYVREGNESGILKCVETMKRYCIPFGNRHQKTIVNFYAERDDVQNTKYWYEQEIGTLTLNSQGLKVGKHRHSETYLTTIRLCIRKHDTEWGSKIMQDIVQDRNPGQMAWSAVFTWAAFTGKGVDEVERMMNVMSERFPQKKLTATAINDLVEIAMERNDIYMAERFHNLGERREIRPDAYTYILQMKYRLQINDINGAHAAYRKLQTEEIEDNKDLPAVNQLIRAMCVAKEYSFESIIHIVEDINHRRLRFEPETVSALTLLHLSRDELHDAIDLLQTHNFHFSIQERSLIRNALYDFCLDPSHSTTRAWDTYTILTQIFGETPRDQRTTLVGAFFSRRRPDMAVHVFNGMRTNPRPDITATLDTYIAVLMGLARSASTISLDSGALSSIIRSDAGLSPDDDVDIEGFGEGGALGDYENELETLLGSVYSHIKLDATLPSPHPTALLNALMIVYTALGHPARALEFWEQIAQSEEGPSWNSVHAAFRACEEAPWGDDEARRIWRRLRKMDVDIGTNVWASYLGALVGNGAVDEAWEGVETFQRESGEEPGAFMLGTLFSAAHRQVAKQRELAGRIREKYPETWVELEKIGYRTTEEGLKGFNIDRDVLPQ
ncbi:MAG: hypothetical protein Q9165_008475 [Trypethelium subeluteriae]